jgi:nucleoside-diphosphate-sugar epimerase
MRVLVNGIAGFGGSAVASSLIEKGYSVRGIDMTAPSHATLLKDIIDRVDYKWKNLMDISRDDVQGCDVVLHFSAQADVPEGFSSPRYTVMNNVMGTVAALEACRGAKGLQKFILASSANAVQRPKYLPIDSEHPPNPTNPYGASKGAQELMALAWHRSYGVPAVIYRNGVIYGPNMRREIFIFKWLWNILHGKPCVLEGGDQTRDPTYATDAVDAWILGVEADSKEVVGETFQVSYGKEYTVRRVLEECMRACGSKVRVIRRDYRPGEKGMREKFDISKAKEILGYTPRVALNDGLKQTATWIRSL